MPGSSHWRVAAPRALALRAWADELVVYNEATGHTHLLGTLAGKLLRTLLDGAPHSIASLIPHATACAERPTPETLAQIELALTELARLDLVAAEPP
jgi:PqqD family protein of HPr-rel-A system